MRLKINSSSLAGSRFTVIVDTEARTVEPADNTYFNLNIAQSEQKLCNENPEYVPFENDIKFWDFCGRPKQQYPDRPWIGTNIEILEQ